MLDAVISMPQREGIKMPKKVNACLAKKGRKVRTLKNGKLMCIPPKGESVVWTREKKKKKK